MSNLESQLTWKKLQTATKRQQLGQASLLIGLNRDKLIALAAKLSSQLLCKESRACGSCQACYLVSKQSHPDCTNIIPEKDYGALKIDQIRALQEQIYLPPQLGHNKIIIIQTADKLNKAAANSLLKILEEPPSAVYFILIAEQIGTILPTILSRCQRWFFTSDEQSEDYSELLKDISALHQCKSSIYQIVQKWESYEINVLARSLYKLTAEMIRGYFLKNSQIEQALELANSLKPLKLFQQLDKLTELIKSLNYNLSINQALNIENILIGYL